MTTLKIYRSWRAELPLVFVAILFFGAALIATLHFPWSIYSLGRFSILNSEVNPTIPLFFLFPFFPFLLILFRIFNVRYTLDERGIESRVGILSLHQTVVKVRYEDIRSAETFQELWERFVNVGSVEIGTAATGEVEVILSGIYAPRLLQDAILEERDRRQAEGESYARKFEEDIANA